MLGLTDVVQDAGRYHKAGHVVIIGIQAHSQAPPVWYPKALRRLVDSSRSQW